MITFNVCKRKQADKKKKKEEGETGFISSNKSWSNLCVFLIVAVTILLLVERA